MKLIAVTCINCRYLDEDNRCRRNNASKNPYRWYCKSFEPRRGLQ